MTAVSRSGSASAPSPAAIDHADMASAPSSGLHAAALAGIGWPSGAPRLDRRRVSAVIVARRTS
jgi:hypothetical protein